MLSKEEYIVVRMKHFGESENRARKNYGRYFRHYKRQKEKMANVKLSDYAIIDSGPLAGYTYSLAPCTEAVPTPKKVGWGFKKQEEENLMNYASASVIATPQTTEVQDQRKYLAKRLDEVYHSHRDGLESKFGLIDDEAPATLKELKDRLDAGKFTFRDEKDVGRWTYWTDMIRWRDPAAKADQEGFDAARTDLKAKKQAALDIIKIDEPKAGLEAIKALEAWTPTGAAN